MEANADSRTWPSLNREEPWALQLLQQDDYSSNLEVRIRQSTAILRLIYTTKICGLGGSLWLVNAQCEDTGPPEVI